MALVMSGLDKESYDRDYSDLELLRRILSYFSMKKFVLFVVVSSLFLNSFMNVLTPIIVSSLLDTLKYNPSQSYVLLVIGVLLLINILAFFFNFLIQYFTGIAVGDVVLALRLDVFDVLMKRDLAFFDKTPTGKIVSRVTSDTNDFGNVVSLSTTVLSQSLLVIFITVYMWFISPFLTFYTVLIAPVSIVVALSFRKVARRVTLNSRRVLAKINALIQETITGIYTAKFFRREQVVFNEFQALNKTSYNVNLRRGLVMNLIFPLLGLVSSVGIALIIYLGGLQTLFAVPSGFLFLASLFGLSVEPLSPGEWYLFVQALNIYVFPLATIASFWSQFQAGLSSSERVFSLMDAQNVVIQLDQKDVGKLTGDIEFRDVVFGYEPDKLVFDGLSLHISSGETVAIVGHTGAGKSSFVKLLARFYEFQGGQILVDGYDIRCLDLHCFRRQLSIISQEVFLWSDTIAGNLRYGHPNLSDDELLVALNEVNAMDWINDLPDGLNTFVGERGSRLSMGQRQIIAFARILLDDPSIVIMDEATASIDPLTESMIQSATEKLFKNRTTLIIAHRLSTVKRADRIVVFKDGKIIEEGTHQSLLEQHGHYAELYNTYFRHQSLEYIEKMPELLDDDSSA